MADLRNGLSAKDVAAKLADDPTFDFLIYTPEDVLDFGEGGFSRDAKGAAFLQSALPGSPNCPTCGGLMNVNGMQVGHVRPRRHGGTGHPSNAMMQHPFCNSTVAN